MKKVLKKRNRNICDDLTIFEKAALFYLIKHSKIVKFKKCGIFYEVYLNGHYVADVCLSDDFLVKMFLEVYNCEVK